MDIKFYDVGSSPLDDTLVDFNTGRDDLKIFLPPIGGMTAYIWGDASKIEDEDVELTVRVHDECNGSDVFGSDICTCRPYLTHAIEECIKTAQRGGTGVVVSEPVLSVARHRRDCFLRRSTSARRGGPWARSRST